MSKRFLMVFIIISAIAVGSLVFGFLEWRQSQKVSSQYQELSSKLASRQSSNSSSSATCQGTSSESESEGVPSEKKPSVEEMFQIKKNFFLDLFQEKPNTAFYLAVKNNNPAYCQGKKLKKDAQDSCQDNFTVFNFIKAAAENKCENLKSEKIGNFNLYQECLNISSGNCTDLMCEAMRDGSVEKCEKFFSNKNISKPDSRINCQNIVFTYAALRNNDPSILKKNLPVEDTFGRVILLRGVLEGKENFLDKLAEDISWYQMAEENAEGRKYCDKISDPLLKADCEQGKMLNTLYRNLFWVGF